MTGNIKPVAATANMRAPNIEQGTRALPYIFDFAATTSISDDLTKEMEQSLIQFVQTVFIDNSANSTEFTLTTYLAGVAIDIVAQPYSQGYYPVAADVGTLRFTGTQAEGTEVTVAFFNVPMPYVTWGPPSGIATVPSLTNIPISFQPLTAGDNELVAAVAGETIRLYRSTIVFAGATNITFYSGSSVGGTALTGPMTIYAGGAINFVATNQAQLVCASDAELNMYSSAAVNCGGVIGVTQS